MFNLIKKARAKLKEIDYVIYLYRRFLVLKHKLLYTVNPEKSINILFRKKFNRKINLKEPKNLIEKIYWMSFNTDTQLWSKCADKYEVREYIKKCGCENLLNELYGHFLNSNEIDFDNLPNQFVIKTNNACETVIIVKDKTKLNLKKTRKTLNRWLNLEFGYFNAQPHYLRIKPCIIVERLLVQPNNKMSLIDYKFTCFNGIVECIQVASERKIEGDHSYLLNLYDSQWNAMNDKLTNHKNKKEISKPVSFELMKDACMKLGKDIPYVRIDFYEIDGKPIFGEMTFTTAYDYFTIEYYDYLGSKVDLDKISKSY